MRVGVIGGQWGRVHIAALKRLGLSTDVLVTRRQESARRIAAEEGIATFGTDVSLLDDCELIVVASPNHTHSAYIQHFQGKKVICEKPLLALSQHQNSELGKSYESAAVPCYVNYAFAFQPNIEAMTQLIEQGELGNINRVDVSYAIGFAGEHSMTEWLLEVAIHPLSWLAKAFGLFQVKCSRHIDTERLAIDYRIGDLEVAVTVSRCEVISAWDITIGGDKGEASTGGRFAPDTEWELMPCLHDGEEITTTIRKSPECPWFLANLRSVETILRAWDGERNSSLFTASQAERFELSLLPQE
ncbi:MAG: hypothetical protein CMF25_06800 [Kangiellaceae bacterium]|nr:hypothetical protein [Kangiellaceae bacterium]